MNRQPNFTYDEKTGLYLGETLGDFMADRGNRVRRQEITAEGWKCTYTNPVTGKECDYEAERFNSRHLDEHYGSHHRGDRSN